jgi:hypothetical protein
MDLKRELISYIFTDKSKIESSDVKEYLQDLIKKETVKQKWINIFIKGIYWFDWRDLENEIFHLQINFSFKNLTKNRMAKAYAKVFLDKNCKVEIMSDSIEEAN